MIPYYQVTSTFVIVADFYSCFSTVLLPIITVVGEWSNNNVHDYTTYNYMGMHKICIFYTSVTQASLINYGLK